MPHRLYLTNGWMLEGDLLRPGHGRLADYLTTVRGYMVLHGARGPATMLPVPEMVVALEKVLYIEEIAPGIDPVQFSPSLAVGKVAQRHRFYLEGCTLEGRFYRIPHCTLSDQLGSMKGFAAVLDARDLATGQRLPFVAFNLAHLLLAEEIPEEAP